MATLSAEQLQDLRDLTGTSCTPQDVNDDVVQRLFDRATALGGNSNVTEASTVVFILQRMMGLARTRVDQTGDFGNQRNSQFFRHIVDDLLPYWERKAGMYGGAVHVGVLALDLDWADSDTDALYESGDE